MNTYIKSHNPTILVIFGVTGDLVKKKLLPAILHLYREDALPKKLKIIGFSRRDWNDAAFREEVRKILHLSKRSESDASFLKLFSFQGGYFNDKQSYINLSKKVNAINEHWKICTNILFHLAVPPTYYFVILKNLSHENLTSKCGPKEGWSRILVEKPFGNDYDTAIKLDKHLGKIFKERQIFRVDHYLAKDTMQNILVFRFSNAIFEPVWNNKYIEKVEIRMLEKNDVKDRGEFYDAYGALRDVGQNHILQMLALMTMENPRELNGNAIREERAQAVSSLVGIGERELKKSVVRGQYRGYRNVKDVKQNSQTETYFKIKASVASKRWRGVPFYLESGKALKESRTEITVHFKAVEPCFFCLPVEHEPHRNVLTFKIHPGEGIAIRFWAKKPGLTTINEPKNLLFYYRKNGLNLGGYEKLLYDAIIGDQTLFASTQEVMAAWRFITPIVKEWHRLPLHIYKKGSWGPVII